MPGGKPFPHRRPGLLSNSWGGPEYSDWRDEQISWKTDCYLGDWSWLTEFTVTGPDALRFFSDWAVNSFAKFDVDQAKHAVFCNTQGQVIGEGVLTRHAAGRLEFNAAGPVIQWLQYQLARGDYRAEGTLAVSQFKLQVSGPKSLLLLERFAGEALRDIGFMRQRTIAVEGVPIAFLRQGMAGEIGFELHGPAADAERVRARLIALGPDFGMRRLGSRTAMINHLEAGFPTVIHDYLPAITNTEERDFLAEAQQSAETLAMLDVVMRVRGSLTGADASAWFRTPYELGWGKSVKFDHAFHGREALEREAQAPCRRIVSLVWNRKDVVDCYASLFRDDEPFDFMEMPRSNWLANYASSVTVGGREIGVATARGYSVWFRRMLSHCVIDVEHADPGTEVIVHWGTPGGPIKRIRATVDRYPYKTDRRRSDLDPGTASQPHQEH